MKVGMNSGRAMDMKVLDYADAYVPCWLSDVVDRMSRYLGIPVSRTYVQGLLEANGYRIKNAGGILLVDRAPEEQVS